MAIKFSSEINIPPEYTAHIDTGLFSRAIDNIISNSIRYTPKGGSINLSAYIRQEKAVIEIVDSGKGIPPGELKKVTEPFFRGTKSRREQGFGLGLSIVKSVADTHSWILKIESADGGGTRIAISGI
jgi:signal transduction histidine kinase